MGEDEIDEGRSGLSAVAISYGFPECAAVVSMLHSYGIPATVHPGRTVSVNPLWIVALGGLQLCVPDFHFADAHALLQAAEPYESSFTGGWSETRWIDIVLSVLLLLGLGLVPPPHIRIEIAARPFRRGPIGDGPERRSV